MFYQDVLHGRKTFVARRAHLGPFRLHTHHEIELIYCLSGHMTATVGGITREVRPGDLLYVGSMKPHGILEAEEMYAILVEIGPVFLEERFAGLAALSFEDPVLPLRARPEWAPILAVFEDLIPLVERQDTAAELMLIGDLYRLCACLLSAGDRTAGEPTEKRSAREIERVLSLVYTDYPRNVTIEEAARLAGYGKSNFCKLFKDLMGVSFHTFLNEFRVKNAKYLLRTTTAPIASVGESVGLPDPKTFCRVFREVTGLSPGEYRRTS